ncbi:hypothetical protein R1sor_016000 [Riccia sorocarpa]|uniref:HEAT repeat-containing protein n=1 Tax=Riccia sorocarpa TaxID=122646 RepID=A0ABD3HFR4_9MARC
MEAIEAKAKKQSVTEIWQSLKNQFSSAKKHTPKSKINWNEFSGKTKPLRTAISSSPQKSSCGAKCDSPPYILGIPRNSTNSPDELGNLQKDLRSTAKAVLRSLEEEKQVRAVLENLEEEKKKPSANPRTKEEKQGVIHSPHNNSGSDHSVGIKVDCLKERNIELQLPDVESLSLNPNTEDSIQKEKVLNEMNSLSPHTSIEDSPHNACEDFQERGNMEVVNDVKINLDGSDRTENVKGEAATSNTGLEDKKSSSNKALVNINFPVDDEPPTSATDEELVKLINKDVNCLHDPTIDVRFEALHSLHRALLGDFFGECQYLQKRNSCFEESEEADIEIKNTGLFESLEKFTWCVEEVVVKPLLKILSDTSERCRYLSVSILIALLDSAPRSVITLLPYIIPVLSSRFPIKSLPTEDPSTKVEIRIVEKSEDIRLLLVNFLHRLLKVSTIMIHPFASDTATILTAAACDSSPEVLMETLAAMTFFGEICGVKLKPVAKLLLSVVVRSLSQNRHRVRVAAVRTIHRLVLCGGHESIYELTAFRDPNTVPIRAFYQPDPKTQYLALLAGDRSIQVREQLLRTVASWLQELDERKEHECRLVPYLLSGFTDESPIIQELAFQLMEQVGRQYEEENENEVKDTQIYLPEDIDDLATIAGKPLPTAFKCRPCLGARILARNCCAVMLHALSGDLDAWTTGTKSLAADFLHTLLLFVEEHITMHLQLVIVILMKASKDPQIATKVSICANVLGHFVDPTAYMMIILPRITGELYGDVSIQQLAQAIKLLANLMQGSPAQRLTNHVPEICSVLSDTELMKSIQLDVNQNIIVVAREMVRAWTNQVKEETISILWILLNAAAAADFSKRPALEAGLAIEALATTCGHSSTNVLIGSYGETIFDLLPHPQFWAMRSLDVLVFYRVVQVAPFLPPSAIERLFVKISWFGWGTWDPDPKQWLLRGVQKMVEATEAAAAVPSSSAQAETISKIQEGMVTLLDNFLAPCLGQVQGGITELKAPTLETVSSVISKGFWNVVVPPSLTKVLIDLDRVEKEHEHSCDEGENTPPPGLSREAALEIVERLMKSS